MRKIGELKGKPIIEGNPNEIKKNQIHYKESDGSITLSERKEDNTLSSVTSGSGSGEGVKEYYYKIINEDNRQYISQLVRTRINTVLIPHNHTDIIKVNRIYYDSGDGFIEDTLSSCLAFSIYDDEAYILEGNGTYKLKKGNLIDKLDDYAKITNMPEEYKEQLQQIYNSTLQEITKEEYESMITYKPE